MATVAPAPTTVGPGATVASQGRAVRRGSSAGQAAAPCLATQASRWRPSRPGLGIDELIEHLLHDLTVHDAVRRLPFS
jgi:hypothetical protein